jgi:hypothetical protein
MVARLVAIAASLILIGAPVVTMACEGICALRAGTTGTTGEHHSCHHEASTSNEAAVAAAAHICGHSEEGPSAVGQALWLLAAPAVIVDTFTLAPPSHDAPPSRGASEHSPPLVSPHSTQLRI